MVLEQSSYHSTHVGAWGSAVVITDTVREALVVQTDLQMLWPNASQSYMYNDFITSVDERNLKKLSFT